MYFWKQSRFCYTLVLHDPVVDVRVVPHEGGLEVVVVPVAVDDAQAAHAQKEPGEGVQEVVVQVQLAQGGAEREGERNGSGIVIF